MTAQDISRRTLAKGAAWSVPAVIMAAPAFAIQASQTTLGAIVCGIQFERSVMNDGEILPVAQPTTISLGIPENVGEPLRAGTSFTWVFTSPEGMPLPHAVGADNVHATFTATQTDANTVTVVYTVLEGKEVDPSTVVCGQPYPTLQLRFGVSPDHYSSDIINGEPLTPGQTITMTSTVTGEHRATMEASGLEFTVPVRTDDAASTQPTKMLSRSGAQASYPWIRFYAQGAASTVSDCGAAGNNTSVTYPTAPTCRSLNLSGQNMGTLSERL